MGIQVLVKFEAPGAGVRSQGPPNLAPLCLVSRTVSVHCREVGIGVTVETRFLPRYHSTSVIFGWWNSPEISRLTLEASRTASTTQIPGACLRGSWSLRSILSTLMSQRGSKLYPEALRLEGSGGDRGASLMHVKASLAEMGGVLTPEGVASVLFPANHFAFVRGTKFRECSAFQF